MDAGQHNHLGVGRGRLAGKRQAVADDVRDRVENLGRLIVVRQDDGVALAFQRQDRLDRRRRATIRPEANAGSPARRDAAAAAAMAREQRGQRGGH